MARRGGAIFRYSVAGQNCGMVLWTGPSQVATGPGRVATGLGSHLISLSQSVSRLTNKIEPGIET